MFDAAVAAAPSIIFIDEVDVIAAKRGSSQRSMDKRIIATVCTCPVACLSTADNNSGLRPGQLLACWDSITMERTGNKPVVVIGATSRPDALDGALRRAGRLVVRSGILIAQHLKFPCEQV